MAISPVICLTGELCCGAICCDPVIECCEASGFTCDSRASRYTACYDPCIHVEGALTDDCDCVQKDNGCSITQFSCGNGCCNLGEICLSCEGGDGEPTCGFE